MRLNLTAAPPPPFKFNLNFFSSFLQSTGYRFNNIGAIPSILADRIRIRKTFADSELTPYINAPCEIFRQSGFSGLQSISPSDTFTGTRRLKMLAESYQSQRHELTMLSCGPMLLKQENDRLKVEPGRVGEQHKTKISFSIESILA